MQSNETVRLFDISQCAAGSTTVYFTHEHLDLGLGTVANI